MNINRELCFRCISQTVNCKTVCGLSLNKLIVHIMMEINLLCCVDAAVFYVNNRFTLMKMFFFSLSAAAAVVVEVLQLSLCAFNLTYIDSTSNQMNHLVYKGCVLLSVVSAIELEKSFDLNYNILGSFLIDRVGDELCFVHIRLTRPGGYSQG